MLSWPDVGWPSARLHTAWKDATEGCGRVRGLDLRKDPEGTGPTGARLSVSAPGTGRARITGSVLAACRSARARADAPGRDGRPRRP